MLILIGSHASFQCVDSDWEQSVIPTGEILLSFNFPDIRRCLFRSVLRVKCPVDNPIRFKLFSLETFAMKELFLPHLLRWHHDDDDDDAYYYRKALTHVCVY